MEIRNTTKFSKEGYYTLNKALSEKTIIAIVIFELVLALFLAFTIFKEKDYLMSVIVGVMMIAYPFVLKLVMSIQIKRNYTINKLAFESMIYEYIFTDDEIVIHTYNNNNVSDAKRTYQSIYKVIETINFIFVFISSNQAYLVEKSTFENSQHVDTLINKFKKENIKCFYKKISVKNK